MSRGSGLVFRRGKTGRFIGQARSVNRLFPAIYDQLASCAASLLRHRPQLAELEPQSLVHETYLVLVNQRKNDWAGPEHLLATAVLVLRRIVMDHQKFRRRLRRGGGMRRIVLDPAIAAAPMRDEAVEAMRERLGILYREDARKATLIVLRFQFDLTLHEAAAALHISDATAKREWSRIRDLLHREIV